jgi:NAD(P)-dependent dehydrogenase (short-subunit alcohol dehydrogenase family)
MADAFLERGCRVVVSGRTQEAVGKAVDSLADKYDSDHILGQQCDVSDYDQVQDLWDASVDRFGQVDIWINNAGQSQAIQDFWTLEPTLIEEVVSTNMIGTMFGSKVAISGMLEQGYGALYNMEGSGSDGRIHSKMILYASTKRGGNLLIKGLAKEVEDTPVIVGSLSPGMVVTDLLLRQRERNPEEWKNTKRIFNIIGDKVETVTPWLVDQMLENEKNGVAIQWSSRAKIMLRFITAPFIKRDIFGDEENTE